MSDKEVLRCSVTGNPCGTDTVPSGGICHCDNCLKWLSETIGSSIRNLPPVSSAVIDPKDLIGMPTIGIGDITSTVGASVQGGFDTGQSSYGPTKLSLWYVIGTNNDDCNYNEFVYASSSERAETLWSEFYLSKFEKEPGCMTEIWVERIILVPENKRYGEGVFELPETVMFPGSGKTYGTNDS
jgi:hypothetical protein